MRPDLQGPADWIEVPMHRPGHRGFISENNDDDRISIRFFANPDDRQMYARVWFGPGSQPVHKFCTRYAECTGI